MIRNDPLLKQRRQGLRRLQTEAEKTFWEKVRNRRFCGLKFIRQYSAGPYILDFYCPKAGLAVELDGGQHTEEEARDYDAARSAYLKKHRIEVVRFWNHEVLQDMEGVLKHLANVITSLNNSPIPPLTSRGDR
jgi:very-short-patch-repair endonuclease